MISQFLAQSFSKPKNQTHLSNHRIPCKDPSPSNRLNQPQSQSRQLNQFQKFLLLQIQQLQQSSTSKKSMSNVVTVQNTYGALKQSIINYYFDEQRLKKKKTVQQITEEIATLKEGHAIMKNCIQAAIKSFYQDFVQAFSFVVKQNTRLQQENCCLKKKVKEISSEHCKLTQENKTLRQHLKEWEEAKQIRKQRKENLNEPTLENIEKIIKDKLVKDNSSTKLTPLKEFNLQNYANKRASFCNSASSNYENLLNSNPSKKLFRGSSITDVKCTNFNSFADSLCFEERQATNLKHKKKLKVVSLAS